MPYIPFLIAFLTTLFITPVIIRFAKKYDLVDDPKKRFHPAHVHKGIIPRAGGLAIFIGLFVSTILFLPLTVRTWAILGASSILIIVGLLDDKKDIHPYIRLGTNLVASLIVIGVGVGIPYITNPFTGGIIDLSIWTYSFPLFGIHTIIILADLFALLWIMWTMNIIGWSAGVDGQMPGFVTISAVVLGLLSMRFSIQDPTQSFVTTLAFITAGAFFGFLPWNFYPQKIMPGYGGKTLAGFLLALIGILSYAKVGTALLVLGVPMIDAVYTLIRRIGSKKLPVLADRGHLHHRLLDLGWGKRRIALFYWIVSAILGSIALTVTSKEKVFTFLLVMVAVGGFLLWVNFFTQFSKQHDQDSG
ncbi:undecaprenyl/decaprenyl-phosphate alpha-N-acetylglucosaminyl 1-phosphate transferase [Candidatus Gottesmanbacteria bacterium]|nr:undecaprenyl/decaprenyl-phosphate alpha-N-acetylglucosaminyl 1-phosphate transferase [Candidatus Gottesmanbacteria bacterium]